MDCDSKLFLKNGIDVFTLGKYIEENYGKSKIVNNCLDLESFHGSICFEDKNGDQRRLWISTYETQDNNSETPVPIIGGKSCVLILKYWGNSVKILQDIAQNFGGGYVQKNDCGIEDGTDEWFYVDGENNDFATDTEAKVWKIVQNANDRGDLRSVNLAKFIITHLDEIKNI